MTYDPAEDGTEYRSSLFHDDSVASSLLSGTQSSIASHTGTGSGAKSLAADLFVCKFYMGGEYYALDVSCVGEVFVMSGITAVPMAPPEVLGLINLRGRALAVVDLGKVLGLGLPPAQRDDAEGTALVLRAGTVEFCVRIDSVEAVVAAHSSVIRREGANDTESAIAGFLDDGDGKVATMIDDEELVRRLASLRIRGE